MMSNILIIVLHVKQTHKLPVESPLLALGPRETAAQKTRDLLPHLQIRFLIHNSALSWLQEYYQQPLVTLIHRIPFPSQSPSCKPQPRASAGAWLWSHLHHDPKPQLPITCFGFSAAWSSWQCCAEDLHSPHLLIPCFVHFIAEVSAQAVCPREDLFQPYGGQDERKGPTAHHPDIRAWV